MKRVEGIPRSVGREQIEFELGPGYGTSMGAEMLGVPATIPLLRKAGERIGQRTVLVFLDDDVLFDVEPFAEAPPPPAEHIMQFFAHAHLPPHLAAISQPIAMLAEQLVDTLPRNPERTVALRKLLESKDAAVRAKLAK